MATVNDFIKVFESSDGGSGDPAKTIWQFFVGAQAVTTTNRTIAETMQLAVNTNSKVQVTYDPTVGNTMSQARIQFAYVCNSRPIVGCQPPDLNLPAPPPEICETIRYAPCRKED